MRLLVMIDWRRGCGTCACVCCSRRTPRASRVAVAVSNQCVTVDAFLVISKELLLLCVEAWRAVQCQHQDSMSMSMQDAWRSLTHRPLFMQDASSPLVITFRRYEAPKQARHSYGQQNKHRSMCRKYAVRAVLIWCCSSRPSYPIRQLWPAPQQMANAVTKGGTHLRGQDMRDKLWTFHVTEGARAVPCPFCSGVQCKIL